MLLSVLAFTCLACDGFSPANRATFLDLDRLSGGNWKGTLTYLDYSANKPVTIKSSLFIERVHSGPSTWVWYFGYSEEPDHNSGTTVSLEYDGRRLDKETVLSREDLPQQRVRIVTETHGSDNDRPATLRHVYLIGDRDFSLQNLVRFDGTKQFSSATFISGNADPLTRFQRIRLSSNEPGA